MFIFRFFRHLFRAVWAGLNTIRRILHLILLLAIFGILLAGAVGQPVPVPSSAALVINPTGMLVEQLEGSRWTGLWPKSIMTCPRRRCCAT